MDDDEDGSCPLNEMLDDKLRVCYYKGYLTAVAQAIKWVTITKYYFLLKYACFMCLAAATCMPTCIKAIVHFFDFDLL